MTSITIHNLDTKLNSLIRQKAQTKGLSLNKTIQELLSEALGVTPQHSQQQKKYFQDFCGVWNKRELTEFQNNSSDLSNIDSEDWQ